jgi:hypothetical protein
MRGVLNEVCEQNSVTVCDESNNLDLLQQCT